MAEAGQPAGGLYDGFLAYRTPSDTEIRDVLRTALVAFDTNVLLNLYRYSEEARASVVEVMQALGDRLWLPFQVLEEFWRNRERALGDPMGQVRTSSAELEKLRNAAVEQLRIWVNRAALSPEETKEVEELLGKAFEEGQRLLNGLIDENAIQRARNTEHDPVLAQLDPVLAGRVGAPMNPSEYAEAVKEGQRRAAAGEPPGFADVAKSDRGGEGASGDYLVWEQVLREASTRGCQAVVLVTGDVKRDWWRYEGSYPRGPRIELAREMKGRCGAKFVLPPAGSATWFRRRPICVRGSWLGRGCGTYDQQERTFGERHIDRMDEKRSRRFAPSSRS